MTDRKSTQWSPLEITLGCVIVLVAALLLGVLITRSGRTATACDVQETPLENFPEDGPGLIVTYPEKMRLSVKDGAGTQLTQDELFILDHERVEAFQPIALGEYQLAVRHRGTTVSTYTVTVDDILFVPGVSFDCD